MFRVSIQPRLMQLRGNDHWRAFLVSRLVELPHYGVLISIDREHGEAHYQFARSRVCPAIPQTGDAERITRGQLNLPAHRFARLIAGFIEVIDQHQPVLSMPPCSAVAGLF